MIMRPTGIKSFFAPKVSKEKEKEEEVIIVVDDDNNNNNSTSPNENSSSSSNIAIIISDDKPNVLNNIKDTSSKPIHPLFQKAVKKDVINLNSSSKSSDSKNSKNSATSIVTSNTSGRPKRSCTQTIVNITNLNDDDEDEYEDPFEDINNNDDIIIEDEIPKKQSKSKFKEKDNSTVATKSKEFFMSAEEKQRQKDRENEENEKLKDLEMQIKFKKELKENAKKFEVKGGSSSSSVNSFFNSNTYSTKKSNSINLVDDDNDTVVDDYCPYLIQKPVGLPSISDYLQRNTSNDSYKIVWREKTIEVIEIDQTSSSSSRSSSSSESICIDLNVVLQVSPYHSTESFGHNEFRNLWNHFLSHNERKAQDISSFKPISQDNATSMFEPQNSSQVIGNRREVKHFLKWLEYLAGKRRAGKKKRKSRSSRSLDEDDIENEISKVMVVTGPSGSGKTSTVYACAREAGFKVIEINASQDRSGSGIRKLFSEAAQSHGLIGVETGSSELNLILFDDADLVFDEDSHMYSAIKDLLKNSKCPVIITTETPLAFLNNVPHEKIVLQKLNYPEISCVIKNALHMAQVNNLIPDDILSLLGILSNGDSRGCLNCIQLMMSALCHESIQSCSFSSFMDWIHKANVDFAQFDNTDKIINSIIKKDQIPSLTVMSNSSKIQPVANVFSPIITSSEPRKGLISGGFLVNITGKNFLQHQISNHYESPTGSMTVSVYLGDIQCDAVVLSDTEIVMRVPKVTNPGVYMIVVKISDGLDNDSVRSRCISSDFCGLAGGWIQLESKRKLITSYYHPIKKGCQSKKGKSKQSLLVVDDPIEDFDDDDDDFEPPLVKKKNKRRIEKKEKKIVDSDDDMIDDNGGIDCDMNTNTNRNKRTKRNNIIDDDDNESSDKIVQAASPLPLVESTQLNIEKVIDTNTITLNAEVEDNIYQCLLSVCSRIQKHRLSGPFRFPVSEEEAPEYHDIITKPMDISTIEDSLKERLYYNDNECDVTSFVSDIRQIWINCKTYNKPNSDIVKVANTLNDVFEKDMLSTFKTIANEDISIVVNDKYILIRGKKVFELSNTTDDDDDNVQVEELPTVDNATLRQALNSAFLHRSQLVQSSMKSASRDAGLEYENEGLIPVHVIQYSMDEGKGCLKALEESWHLRETCSSSELFSTYASYLTNNLVEDDDYLDYHDYQTPQQLALYSNDIMQLSSNIFQTTAKNAMIDADINPQNNAFLRCLTDVENVPFSTNNNNDDNNNNNNNSNENPISTIVTGNKANEIVIDDDSDDLDQKSKKDKSRKSPKIVDDDDEEMNFDEDYDDDEDDDVDDDDDDLNTNIKANVCIEESYFKCWYELGNEIGGGGSFLRYSIRKQAYINFVTNILCFTEPGNTDYNTFRFSKNMKKNSVNSIMALDIVPLVAKMLHSDLIQYEVKALNSRLGESLRTRGGKNNNSKYNYIANATQLSESTLSSLLEYGFISSPRAIGFNDKPQWMI